MSVGSVSGEAFRRSEELLREASPGGYVLVMSASLHPSNIGWAMREGADEVLDKLSPPAEVVGTVRRLGNA